MPLPLFDKWLSLLESKLPQGSTSIGVGLNNSIKVTQSDLKKARSITNLIIIGESGLGHEDIVSKEPEQKLVQMLNNDEIQGIVKIDVNGIKLRNAYMQTFGLSHVNRGCLVSYRAKQPNTEEYIGRTAMIYPVSPEEGATENDREKGILEAVKELRMFTQESLHIGLLALCRAKTAKEWNYDAPSRNSYEEAERLALKLNNHDQHNITAKNYGIELENALQNCDIISPYRGAYGGLLYRTISFLGSAREIACPSFTMHPYIGGTNNLGNILMRVQYALAKYGAMKGTSFQ